MGLPSILFYDGVGGDVMTDKETAILAVESFLQNENKKYLLVRGYDNEAKLRVVLSCLDRYFSKGIIRTSSMSNIASHVNRAFKKNLLPDAIKSTAIYKLGKMSINISSYATHTQFNPEGNKDTFTLIYPVQMVLDDSNRLKKFIIELAEIESKKIILITSNEWSIDNWDIESYMDEVFFYSVESDNPQIMTNLRNNGAI